jgi:Flp pilus assembly protein TadG
LFGYLRGEAGNFAAVIAILLVPLVGALSMGIETSNWFLISRAAQNAADSAAIAAANNGNPTPKTTGGTAEYIVEGKANASSYGFTDGSGNVTVTVVNGQTCPDTSTNCFKATVTKVVPLYLTAFVGFRGDTTIGTARAKTVTSTAMAEPLSSSAVSFPSCLTALGSDANSPGNGSGMVALQGSGTPTANAPACSISAVGPTPSSIACTGSNGLGAPYGFATGTISGSGGNTCTTQSGTSTSFTFCNPYSSTVAAGCTVGTIAGSIATAVSGASGTPCTVSQSGHGNGNNQTYTLAAGTAASCTYNAGGSGTSAGNTLTMGGSLSPSTPMVIVVSGNGYVDMAGFSTSNITWIFTGTAPGTFAGGTSIDITAPNNLSGSSLKGVAAYQVPSSSCTHSQCSSWTENGSQTVQVTGLFYMPYTNGSFGGSVSESSTGNCFISVFNAFSDNGTGLLLDEQGCTAAGLGSANLPYVQRYRAALVQ